MLQASWESQHWDTGALCKYLVHISVCDETPQEVQRGTYKLCAWTSESALARVGISDTWQQGLATEPGHHASVH